MKYLSLQKWKDKENNVGSIFFAQRLEELLFEYTLDSFKPRTLNSCFLCREAIEIIKEIETECIDQKNIEHIIDELNCTIKDDIVAKKLLNTPYEQYGIEDNSTIPIQQLKLKLNVLAGELNPLRYLNKCFEMLTIAILNPKPQKKDIDLLSNLLVTHLLNLGFNKNYLASVIRNIFFEGAAGEIVNVQALLEDVFENRIFPYTHTYTVYFTCSQLIIELNDSLKAFGAEIVNEIENDFKEFTEQNKFNCKNNQKFICFKNIDAYDVNSARIVAENKLSKIADMFVLFHHKKRIEWSGSALIIQKCCSKIPHIVKPQKNPMEIGFDLEPKFASARFKNFLQEQNLSRFSFEKFNSVVDLHGLCAGNPSPENQLINIWTSFETIVPGSTKTSKIINIISEILPILMSNYIRRIIERVISDMFNYDKASFKKLFKSMVELNKEKLNVKCFLLLSNSKYNELLKQFYTACKDFHLLRYRLFRLNEILQDSKKLEDFILKHYTRVCWQIRRLYRTRNLIVHSGHSPKYLPSLIENAHYYLDETLNTFLYLSCSTYRFKDFSEAFEFYKMHYSKLLKTIKNTSTFEIESCKIVLGII